MINPPRTMCDWHARLPELHELRRAWIEALRDGKNPIDNEVRHALLQAELAREPRLKSAIIRQRSAE
jgi:hypothetical protein